MLALKSFPRYLNDSFIGTAEIFSTPIDRFGENCSYDPSVFLIQNAWHLSMRSCMPVQLHQATLTSIRAWALYTLCAISAVSSANYYYYYYWFINEDVKTTNDSFNVVDAAHDTVCQCGKKCKGRKGLRMHQRHFEISNNLLKKFSSDSPDGLVPVDSLGGIDQITEHDNNLSNIYLFYLLIFITFLIIIYQRTVLMIPTQATPRQNHQNSWRALNYLKRRMNGLKQTFFLSSNSM